MIVPGLEKQAYEIAFSDNLTEFAESKERKQDQKGDDARCNELIECIAAADRIERVDDAAVMQESIDDLFDTVEHQQQNQIGKRLVQSRPNERTRLEALSDMKHFSKRHEFRAYESLYGSEG